MDKEIIETIKRKFALAKEIDYAYKILQKDYKEEKNYETKKHNCETNKKSFKCVEE